MPPDFPVKLNILYRNKVTRTIWVQEKVSELVVKFWETLSDCPCPRMWFNHSTGFLLLNMNEIAEIALPRITE